MHGYQSAFYLSRGVEDRSFENINGSMQLSSLKSPSTDNANYRDSLAFALGKKLYNGSGVGHPPGFENVAVSRNRQLQPERSNYDSCSSGHAANTVNAVNTKKYHSLLYILGYSILHRASYVSDKNAPWDGSVGYGSFAGMMGYEPSLYSNFGSRTRALSAFDEVSPSKVYREALSSQLSSSCDTESLWSKQPFEQFGVADKIHNVTTEGAGSRPNAIVK